MKIKLFLRLRVLGIHAIAPDEYVFLSRRTSSSVRCVQYLKLTKIDGARPESQSPAVHEGEEIYCLVR
jgi:hypothetical protein